MKVREATLDDAQAIAKVNVDAWRSAYRKLIPDVILDKMSYDDRAELVKQFLVADEKKIFTYVIEDESGIIVGFRNFYKSIEGKEIETKVEDLGGFQDEITAYGWKDIGRLTELSVWSDKS